MNDAVMFDYQTKIIKVIEIFFPNAKIYFFGSRARGDFDERSDFDIAIDIGQRMPITQRGQIMSMIDALNIIQKVDIVDFHAIPEKMQKIILTEGIVWKK